MGKTCTIDKEINGHCTGWDGVLDDGKNAWKKLESVVNEIPCETCRDDGKLLLSGAHDVVNITIGETVNAYNPKNLKNFTKRVNDAYNTCVKSGNCGEHGVK